MSISTVFEATRGRGEIALIPYVTAGFPSVEVSLDLVGAAAAAGADAVEIGLPFSDPVADGPTIQFASHEALRKGFRPKPFLDALLNRPRSCPLIVMTYLNPLLALGFQVFPLLARAGVSALVVPDLPAEEAGLLSAEAARSGIDVALLLAPTSSPARARLIGSASRGFVYVVGVVGTTGARSEVNSALPEILNRARAHTTLPLVAGFGLSDPAHIQALTGSADGAIVGSRLVEAVRQGEDFSSLVRSFKQASRRR